MGVRLEERYRAGGVRFVDPAVDRVGEEDAAVLVHRRARRRLVGVADLLPRLVAVDQRVDGAARARASPLGRRGRLRRAAAGTALARRIRRRRQQLAARDELRKDAASRALRRFLHRNRLRVVAPEPAQRVRKHRCAVAIAVAVFAELDLHVVARELERRRHPRVLDVPAAGVVHEILTSRLHEHADRPRLGAPDETRQTIGAAEVAEAADPRDHAAELVRTVPRGDERADAAGADAGDAVVVRILREVVARADLGHDLLDQEIREARRERVVLEDALVSVLRLLRERRQHARVDEDRDHRRHVALRDQVIEDHGHAHGVAGVAAPVEKDHVRDRPARVVLRRHVHLIVVRRAREKLSGREHRLRQRSAGNTLLRLRVAGE